MTGLLRNNSLFCSVESCAMVSSVTSMPACFAKMVSKSGQFMSSALRVIKKVGGPNVLNISKRSSLALCQYAMVPLMLCKKAQFSESSGLSDTSRSWPAVRRLTLWLPRFVNIILVCELTSSNLNYYCLLLGPTAL